jgi:SOS-response transcriptional repressor LexA
MRDTKAISVEAARLPGDMLREGLPLLLSPVAAGFPSPAEDYLDRKLDLHEYLVRNHAATFFLRASGDSMKPAGIQDGDLLWLPRLNLAAVARRKWSTSRKRYIPRLAMFIW